jgi:hypothetical protein
MALAHRAMPKAAKAKFAAPPACAPPVSSGRPPAGNPCARAVAPNGARIRAACPPPDSRVALYSGKKGAIALFPDRHSLLRRVQHVPVSIDQEDNAGIASAAQRAQLRHVVLERDRRAGDRILRRSSGAAVQLAYQPVRKFQVVIDIAGQGRISKQPLGLPRRKYPSDANGKNSRKNGNELHDTVRLH